MTSIWLLMGLLLLAYLGSFLVSGQAIRGFGLPSSAEYVVLGVVVGPLLGLVDRSTVVGLDPLVQVAIGWLALVVGLDYGFVDGRPVRVKNAVVGSLMTALTGLVVFAVLHTALSLLGWYEGDERLLLAGGVGAATAETTRHAVRWVVARHGAGGPLSRVLAEISDVDDLVAIVATAFLFSLRAPEGGALALPSLAWPFVSLGLGAVMGGLTTLLLAGEFRLAESWGMLLGTSMLAIGLSTRLGLSPLTTLFVMGVVISLTSRHRHEITSMVGPTERAVLLPLLMMAGARIDVAASPHLPWVIAIAVAGRVAGKLLAGASARMFLAEARAASPALGLSLLSTGGLAMSIGVVYALRFPGAVGNAVLTTAAAVTVFGEFVGPSSLRRLLRDAGELADEPRPQPAAEAP